MSDTTPLRTLTIAADRFIRAPLAQIISTIVVVFLAGWWASSVWRDIQDLKTTQAAQGIKIDALCEYLMPRHQPVSKKDDK